MWEENNTIFVRLVIGDDQELRQVLFFLNRQKDNYIKNKSIVFIIGFNNKRIKFSAELLNLEAIRTFILWYFKKKVYKYEGVSRRSKRILR
jgi:hypothetical protein